MNLANLITDLDNVDEKFITEKGALATERILNNYTWTKIVNMYENLFLSIK